MKKKLSAFLEPCAHSLAYTITMHPENDPVIESLAFDSRQVREGSLFFALPGIHVHGNDFAEKAIAAGARAVVYEGRLPDAAVAAAKAHKTVLVQTPDSRFAMSPLSAAFYDYPGNKLCVAGVTGTEGKSTTVFFCWQLLRFAGKKAGFISTVQHSFGGEAYDNSEHQTTPEAPIVQKYLYNMVQNGCEYAVIEASSHGLSVKTNRLGDVPFDAAAMMNVNHEHLEFHGTYEQYKSDKANLFRNLARHAHGKFILNAERTIEPVAVVNAADPAAQYFVQAASGIPVAGFVPPDILQTPAKPKQDAAQKTANAAQEPDAALFKAGLYAIENLEETRHGIGFTLKKGETAISVNAPVAGSFNACNITAALIIVSGITGKPLEQLARSARSLTPVKGRMCRITKGQNFDVFIDYAHTPSSFMIVFPPMRKKTKGRIISVFGSGGERDTQKRPLQGKIASEYSDIVILTDEDPRGEDSMELLEMIAQGCEGMTRGKNLFLIPDRPQAIRKAFSLAQKDDAVLLLGKSHENSIIYKNKTVPYDETREAETALAEMGFGEN